MKTEIKVPAMGESITEATIGTIIKASGSSVTTDDEILELETDKVNQVIYAPQSGILHLNIDPDALVTIGQVIGYIDSESSFSTKQEKSESQSKTVEQTKVPEEPLKEKKDDSICSKSVQNESPNGVIRKRKEAFIEDVIGASEKPQKDEKSPSLTLSPVKSFPASSIEKGQRETRKKMSKIRKVIANRLVEVSQTTAMLTTFNEVDLTHVIALRENYKENFTKKHNVKLGFMSFFVKACVSALQACPEINSYIDGDDIVHREYYDIGIAVGTDRGLFVPVVRNCDSLTFSGIESSIEAFAKKAKEGTLKMEDLTGGGFTITNGGTYGSLLSTPILNPPQSGILGMHKISKRTVVIEDQIVIRPMMYLALSYDHRIVDGKEAVTFLVHIKNCLEDPSRLLLEI
jgi:2-oxoglutarate dehydrogenase E2 component (dihydrolipoamide succinyltransferase)